MGFLFVPAEGKRVRDPLTKQIVPAEGVRISRVTPYWHKRVQDGDGQILPVASKPAAAEPLAKRISPTKE